MATKAQEFHRLGQAIWYDNISRALLDSGDIKALIDQGVVGMTSNPTIFDKAIAGSSDYDADIRRLVLAGKTDEEIFESLAIDDIRQAADLLQPTYEQTSGVDGYISLEVSPTLAHDTRGTIHAARRLFKTVARPNLMIKVPATPEGIPAIETLIGDGININVTLIFSLESYSLVIKAYLAGLAKLRAEGGDLSRVASVASFFVSRVDTLVDKLLAERSEATLQGKIAVANAKLAYDMFLQMFSGEAWEALASAGARVQRPLWASTSTKNPNYPDLIYVDGLVGRDTVNTVPPQTLVALQDHGRPEVTITSGLDEAQAHMARLAEFNIDFAAVTQQLLTEGVESFAKSFENMMNSITRKRIMIVSQMQHRRSELGAVEDAVLRTLRAMDANDIPARVWLKDYTVWGNQPTEIANRLGWLDSPLGMVKHIDSIHDFADEVLADGYMVAIVLGMGGSSLAPEVFARTFGGQTAYMEVVVLDSTDPGSVLDYAARFDPRKTLYIVSSKSGGTVEMVSFFKFFYNQVVEAVGEDEAGKHFIAITDPGSGLVEVARKYGFRHVFLNDANIGGRYSALSFFGLVPAGLDGTDISALLSRSAIMADLCGPAVVAADNPGAWLGAILGEMAKAGRDKVTFVLSHSIASFGDWVEQLIAESTGKNGKGILPVVGESLTVAERYGKDRLFVYLQVMGDAAHEPAIYDLIREGYPVVWLTLKDAYDLGGQFFLWEFATAIAGYVMGIQPFDQPNVESAKVLARQMVKTYNETGALPTQSPALVDGAISVFGVAEGSTAGEVLHNFAKASKAGDYIALQAYMQPTNEAAHALGNLREQLRNLTRRATTVGFGPRFLHSTGQLHKGDSGNGLFIILTTDAATDAPIPDEAGTPGSAMSFNVLKTAQALGDQQALVDNGRRVLRFHLGTDAVGGLQTLIAGLNRAAQS